MRGLVFWSLIASVLACALPVRAARTRTIGIVPDPSCRSSKLTVHVEQSLAKHLHAPGLQIERKDPAGARLLLQYFLLVHQDGERAFIQLDAHVVGNRNGKLYAEGSVRSDKFANDENGHVQAARQAGQRLGVQLSDSLTATLSGPGRGRRIMLQVSLGDGAAESRSAVLANLRRALADMSLRQRGSTDRNLMLTLFSSEDAKDLAERIERALQTDAGLKVTWLVQSRTTLMLELDSGG